MKKNINLLILGLFFTSIAIAQAPKYVLLEHFTNTRCGICGGTNPTFYQNININTNTKLHHLSIHSSTPYSSCVFYQANMAPQDARAAFYGLPGTPRVSVNGSSTIGAGAISASTVDNAYCATCSPIQIKVTEQDNGGGNRSATIQVKSIGTPPTGNFRLFAAIAEKTVNYGAPNGESVHHNVFRQFLTATTGDALSLATQGNETSTQFNYSINGNWVASEVYVLAWLYDASVNTIVNSGTKFDAQIIPIELAAWRGSVDGEKNRLEWTTQSELNTNFFEIERSTDGKLFAPIGRVKAAGNSARALKYTFDDEKPLPNIGYYRLKTVDLDENTSLAPTVSIVRKGRDLKNLTVSPSLATNTIQITYFSNNSAVEGRIVDRFGKVVQQFSKPEKAQNTEGGQTQILDISKLSVGLYFVQLIQNNETTSVRFFKSN